MLFQNFVEVFKRLFGVKPRTTGTEQAENTAFAERYEDVREVNLTAWAAGKIANMVVSDSDITVTGEGARAQLLNGALQACVKRLKNIMTRVFAVGGVVLKPYLHGGRLYTDILPQNRFINIEQVGDVITAAGFVAEAFTRDCKAYVRTEYHRLADGVYTIEQRATVNGQPVALAAVPQWAGIAPVVAISGVRQMLFGIITCPADGRKQMNDVYGVPITYGQDKLMGEITELLDAFQREFQNKEAFIGVSDLLFDGKNKLPGDGVYKKFKDDEGDFFEVFSPDIRAQAYIDGINYRLELLEKAIPRLVVDGPGGLGSHLEWQDTGTGLATAAGERLQAQQLAYRCSYLAEEGTVHFGVWQGKDRTQSQNVNSYAVFSDAFANIGEVEISTDDSNYKNYAVAASRGDGDERITAIADGSGGTYQRQVWVESRNARFDAKKQSLEQYQTDLRADGFNTLATKYYVVENTRISLAAALNLTGGQGDFNLRMPYTVGGGHGLAYMADYDLGDLCDVVVPNAGIHIQARIIAVREVIKNNRHMIDLELGEAVLTRTEKARL